LGTTWRIERDSNQETDQIGSVVTQATSGDTLLIGPGTYYEHIYVQHKELTFIGRAGREQTVLDGSRPIDGREGSILYTDDTNRAGLTVRGLTFQNGIGRQFPLAIKGGAICWPDEWWESTVRILECVSLR
jgi:hypothetical protein